MTVTDNPAVLKILERRAKEKEEKKAKQKEQHRKSSRKWYIANSEHAREKSRRWKIENRARFLENQRKNNNFKKYGIALEDRSVMLLYQGNCCAICGTTDAGGKYGWHVDHCHRTKVIRGILCNHCNRGLGGARDDIETLKKMIAYLERYTT